VIDDGVAISSVVIVINPAAAIIAREKTPRPRNHTAVQGAEIEHDVVSSDGNHSMIEWYTDTSTPPLVIGMMYFLIAASRYHAAMGNITARGNMAIL